MMSSNAPALARATPFLATTGKAEIAILIQKGPLNPGHAIVVRSDDENAHDEPPARTAECRFS